MDIRTITATLAILGSGLTLTACKKATSDASEVPGSQQPAADGSCGADKGHGHASCSGDKTDAPVGDAPPSEPTGDTPATPETPATTETATTASPTPAGSSTTVAADSTTPAATTTTTTTTTTKTKKTGKKKAKGEAACGEGTCG